MNNSIWAAIIGAAAAVLAAWVKSLLDKRKGDQDDGQKSYDQLQEDNLALRSELAAVRTEVGELRKQIGRVNDSRVRDRAQSLRELNGVWQLVHHLEEENSQLRADIIAGRIPPLPPRPPKPTPVLYGGGEEEHP